MAGAGVGGDLHLAREVHLAVQADADNVGFVGLSDLLPTVQNLRVELNQASRPVGSWGPHNTPGRRMQSRSPQRARYSCSHNTLSGP